MRPSILLVAISTALIGLSCGKSSRPPARAKHNVLLITLDTTRADRIGAYGYTSAETPILDQLAGNGILFEQCITPSAYTLPAHSTIMTGLYPPHHGVRLNGAAALGEPQITLAEHLSAAGYRTGAFAGAFVLDGRWGLAQGFQHYDDEFERAPDQPLSLAEVQRPANQVVDAALNWLDQDRSRPFFGWVHFYDAHTPYEPPEPFRSRFSSGGLSSLYDGEIAFADTQVGRLLQWLDQHDLDKNTIVVVVGDHGEGLGSHEEAEHGYFIYDYAVRVPLIMRVPGSRAVRVADQVRTIDIFTTIIDLVGGEYRGRAHGASLLPLIEGKREKSPRYAYSESMAPSLQYGWSALYSLRTNEYKYIDAPRSELYDLRQDPDESQNRLDSLRRVARQLRDELTRLREEGAKGAPKTEEANLDQETMSMLASLGYVGGTSTSVGDQKDLADPKDKIHLYEGVGYAAHLMSRDDFEQAAEVLETVLQEDPKVPQAQLLLASAYRQSHRLDKAKDILDAYLKRDPGNVWALIAMADILSDEGKYDQMLAICKRALAKDERNAHAYELMAEAHMAANEHGQALPLLRKAVEIQPKLTRSRINLAAAHIGVGKLAEAEQQLQGIIKEYPKFPLAHFHLALLRERQGRLGEARSEYQTEVTNQPRSLAARFNLGNLLLRLGDPAGAEQQMRTLIEQDPQSARPYLMLGQILLTRSGQLAEVERLAQAGLARAKEPEVKALGYFLLADVYSRQGRRAELRDAVQKGNHYRSLIRG